MMNEMAQNMKVPIAKTSANAPMLAGKMTWYHVPSGSWTDSMTYTGTLFAVAGPPFSAATFNANQVKRTAVGSATLSFTSSSTGTWSYSINGVSGSKSISRLPF